MRVHFIAIGGSAMHNLAIALKQKGYKVSGSDDEIHDPALSRLKAYDLLPESIGWNPEKITNDLDAVILGMHAKSDNPELLKAKEFHNNWKNNSTSTENLEIVITVFAELNEKTNWAEIGHKISFAQEILISEKNQKI